MRRKRWFYCRSCGVRVWTTQGSRLLLLRVCGKSDQTFISCEGLKYGNELRERKSV